MMCAARAIARAGAVVNRDVFHIGFNGIHAVGDRVLALLAAIGPDDGFGEVYAIEEFESLFRADDDDELDRLGCKEGFDGALQDGLAIEGGGQFVEAHALAGAGSDDDCSAVMGGGSFSHWWVNAEMLKC